MKRRSVILGFGATAIGSATAVGSGAFSSSSAERRVTVSVADDTSGFLGIDEVTSGGRAQVDGNTAELFFPSLKETSPRTGGDPDLGLGSDSVYEFDKDTNATEDGPKGLLKITNQSSNPIVVYSKHDSSDLEIELYDVTTSERKALQDEPAELGIGQELRVGVRISTMGASTEDYQDELTIVGEAADD